MAACSQVWPFETGFTDSPGKERNPYILHAEIYPSACTIDAALHGIPDAAQVLSLARYFAQQDETGQLATAFKIQPIPSPLPGQPPLVTQAQLDDSVAEEGWILK